ncbi:Hint domain-containing protein [Leisingera sp.]|uniref:Hint domain-containing protein n=1 Tax=Leisingera sp. TaxID=1879318 RepID=UPI003A8E86DE
MAIRTLRAYPVSALTVDASSSRLAAHSPVRGNADVPDGTVFEFDASQPAQQIRLFDSAGRASSFEDGLTGGHQVIEGGTLVPAGSRVSAQSLLHLQQVTTEGAAAGPVVTVSLYSRDGAGADAPWGFATSAPLLHGGRYEKLTGSNYVNGERPRFVPCFVTGTRIATHSGLRPVERLRPGDLVLTRDNGYQPLLWVGLRQVGADWMRQCPHLQPVRIAADAFGPGCPPRDLWVSPQHRLLQDGVTCQLLFGEPEALAAASHLLAQDGIERQPVAATTYVHLLFAQHQLVLSEGLWSESFRPGARLLADGGAATRREILELFPDLAHSGDLGYPPARLLLKPQESQLLHGSSG